MQGNSLRGFMGYVSQGKTSFIFRVNMSLVNLTLNMKAILGLLYPNYEGSTWSVYPKYEGSTWSALP
jgi:hypothetical protein